MCVQIRGRARRDYTAHVGLLSPARGHFVRLHGPGQSAPSATVCVATFHEGCRRSRSRGSGHVHAADPKTRRPGEAARARLRDARGTWVPNHKRQLAKMLLESDATDIKGGIRHLEKEITAGECVRRDVADRRCMRRLFQLARLRQLGT